MQHIPWNGDMAEFPEPLRRYLRPGHVFDSSSSAEATVYYSDIGQGCSYGALRNEAAMTRYFHDKGLAAAVLHYGQDHDSNDWLATACLPGDDCTASLYVREPERLAAVRGRRLRMLHEQDQPDALCRTVRKTIWRQWSGIMRRDVQLFLLHAGGNADTRYIAWCGSMATNCVTIRCCMVIIACRMSYLTIGGSAVSLIWIAPESATCGCVLGFVDAMVQFAYRCIRRPPSGCLRT